MSTESEVLALTRREFSGFEENAHVEALDKGGSGRRYFRVSGGGRSLVFSHYTAERLENARYVDAARFLRSTGVRVPEIHRHLPEEGCLWMEDAGPVDLWTLRNEPWRDRLPLYISALRAIARMHTLSTRALAASGPALEAPFDEALYRWEQAYFFENCLRAFFQVPDTRCEHLAALPELTTIPARLASRDRVLVHRDFQSQNIMIRDSEAMLIDFQGMRMGVDAYDVASLIYDPYTHLTADEREELVAAYCAERVALGNPAGGDFSQVLDLCAAQRLMQALGAYGFLGLKKGKPAFLEHIPAALGSLDFVIARISGLAPLSEELRAHL